MWGAWPLAGTPTMVRADPSRARPPLADGAEAWNFPGDAARCKAGRRVSGVGLGRDLLVGPSTPQAPRLLAQAPAPLAAQSGRQEVTPSLAQAVRDNGPASRPRSAGHTAPGGETATSLGHLGW